MLSIFHACQQLCKAISYPFLLFELHACPPELHQSFEYATPAWRWWRLPDERDFFIVRCDQSHLQLPSCRKHQFVGDGFADDDGGGVDG